jgi:oxygen-dependent protoporphyrinogen oxidase
MKVAIVGGGITGLATAFEVQEAAAEAGTEIDVVVLEAGEWPGGNIRTERVDGYVIENGPNGFLDNAPTTVDLVRRIGLADELRQADEAAARRFIYRNGSLHEVPTGPLGFLRSPLLSFRGRLRVFAEPFARGRPASDETIYEFAARRIGPEAASVLVDAMVSGVFAGNVRALSLRSSFPKMYAMESEHGGLVRAMVARMGEKRAAKKEAEARRAAGEDVEEMTRPGGPAGPGGTLTSFRDGLDRWITQLVEVLRERGVEVRTGAPVAAIERGAPDAAARSGSSAARGWRVRLASDEAIEADAVVVTIPSPRAAPLLEPADAALAEAVAEIPTAGLSVVALGYDVADLDGVDLDGFGFLVPRSENLRILGCLWDSSIFPGRAPDGKVLVRAMIGGAHDPAAVTDPDDVLLSQVRRDLERAMGLGAGPKLTRIYRWPLGIGQYTVGHQARLDRIHGRLAALPGLRVAGSSYYGISMNACIEKAAEQGPEIVALLAGQEVDLNPGGRAGVQ